MKILFVVLSFMGFMSSALADDVLVSCHERSGAGFVTIYSVDGYGLVAQVDTRTETFRYTVKKIPPMLQSEYYLTMFDSLRYNSIGDESFRLQLCASRSCSHVDAQGSRAGTVKFIRPGTSGFMPQDRFEFEAMACLF